jgi:hypothetical protein
VGFCVPSRSRASGTACRVAGYNFPSLSGKSVILVLWWGIEVFLAVSDSGECWASMLFGEASLLVPKISLRFTLVCGSRLLALSSKLRIPVGQQSSQA